ncbi:hypothetical protein PHYPO_G00098460 [Pangasianodon hypophthalmus]|uniref:Uncharacterized protein n=1 Tax=Pangasianodon hypophthalmus TaxID=310915 RepID=A0A5N5LD27_PANHP|nr:hypothetical protein PHYPO_G00098460 [Pangasianodon hypophthalmus]
MVTHTRNLCSAFNPSKCTHTVVNEHTHTHTRSSGQPFFAAAPGALLKGLTSVVVLRVGESAGHSLPPPTIPAGPETQTHNLQVASLTATLLRTFLLRRPGSSWGFGALLKGLTSVVVLRVGESAGHSLPLQSLLDLRLERSPSGCKSDSLAIRPRLPPKAEPALRAGFEPARGDPIGFQVQRLNYSAITAVIVTVMVLHMIVILLFSVSNVTTLLPAEGGGAIQIDGHWYKRPPVAFCGTPQWS